MSTPRRGFVSRRAELPTTKTRRVDGPLSREEQAALTNLFMVVIARQLTPQDAEIARQLARSEALTPSQAGHILDEAQVPDEHMPDSLRPAISTLLGPPSKNEPNASQEPQLYPVS